MGLLTIGGKWVLSIVLPLVILGGVLFYFGQGLQDASLEKFELIGIKGITTESFMIVGNLFVKNPSDLSVPIETIEYEIFLKETGEKIGSGNLPPFTLEKSTTSRIAFNQEVKWVPTTKVATIFLTREEVLIEVKGEVRIDMPKVKEYAIPFSQEADIKEYIQQFVAVPIEESVITDSLPIDDEQLVILS